MQYSLPFGEVARLVQIHARLLSVFGRPGPCFRLDPVSQMVFAMISARTREAVAKSTFENLLRNFSSWEDVAQTPPEKIKPLVRRMTRPELYAVYIPAALQEIKMKRGVLDLSFLRDWPVAAALSWLEKLTGVGPKTSGAILNLSSLHKRALVVDTAHERAAKRLGLVPDKAGLKKTVCLLMNQTPNEWTADDLEDHHVLMQQLGQEYCKGSDPNCAGCPVLDLCVAQK